MRVSVWCCCEVRKAKGKGTCVKGDDENEELEEVVVLAIDLREVKDA